MQQNNGTKNVQTAEPGKHRHEQSTKDNNWQVPVMSMDALLCNLQKDEVFSRPTAPLYA